MDINAQLKNSISKYIYYDNYIREYKKKIDPIKNKRKQLLDDILFTVKTNNIPELNVKLPDGTLGYIEKDVTAPLNNHYIKTMITTYFMENTKDPSKITAAQETAQNLIDYILESRPVKKTTTLKRHFNK